MMMAEGIGRSLNPNVNFWEISRDIIESWGRDNLGPKARIEDKFKDAMSAFNKFNAVAQNLDKIVTDKGIIVNYNFDQQAKERKDNSFLNGFMLATIIGLLLYIFSLWQTY
jgi:predicted unusual protein kinase regulating ubiquinone biosynthesis (AarF/ABC1/UbiB family)